MITKPPLGCRINETHPLSRGIVGCWLFNEGGGNVAHDVSLFKNNGAIAGWTQEVNWPGSIDGSGFSPYQGTDTNHFLIPDSPELQLTDSFSFVVRCRSYVSALSYYPFLYLKTYTDDNNRPAYIGQDQVTGNIRTIFRTAGGYGIMTGGSLWDMKWHTFISSYKVDKWRRAYFDGQRTQNYDGGAVVPMSNSNSNYIGSNNSAYNYFPGIISTLIIYNRALDDEECAMLNNNLYCFLK